MAVLSFKVQADYEKVVKLREEIAKLEAQLRTVGKNTPNSEIKELEGKLSEARGEFTTLATEAAKAGGSMDKKFKRDIREASKEVDAFTAKIIEQKAAVKNVEFDIKKLGESYSKALAKGNSAKASEIKTELDAARRTLDEEKSALFGLTQEQAKARMTVKQLKDSYAEFKDEAGETTKANEGFQLSLGKVAGILGGVAALKALASQVVAVRAQFQDMETQIETLVGKDVTAKIMPQIKEMAKVSPLTMGDIVGAEKMMLSFNIEAEKSIDYLKALSDVSMGNSQKFNSLTLAFSQMSSAGRLMGQDLLQFINAGFNPLQVIAEKTGKSIAQLKEEMSKGAVSAEMVQQAFIDATSAGGKFYNMSENASKTINGQISMLQDAMDAVFNEIGTKSEGIIIKTIQAGTKLVQSYEKIGKVLVGLVATYGAYRTAVLLSTAATSKHTLAEIALTNVRIAARKAQLALNASMLDNPYVAAAVAVAGLASAMWTLNDNTAKAERRQRAFEEEQEQAAQKEKEHADAIQGLIDKVRDNTQAEGERLIALDALKKEYPNIFEQYDIESLKLADILNLKKQINEEDTRRKNFERGEEIADLDARIAQLREAKKYAGQSAASIQSQIDDLVYKRDQKAEQQMQSSIAAFTSKLSSKSVEELKAYLKQIDAKAFKLDGKAITPTTRDTLKKAVQDAIDKINATNKQYYSEDYNEAKKQWEDAKKAFEEVKKDKDKFTTAEFNERKATLEDREKKFKALGGDTTGKGAKTEADAVKAYNDQLAQQEKVAQMQAKANVEKVRTAKDMEFMVEQARINAMKEGAEKTRAQQALDHKKELENLERQKQDYIQKVIEQEKAIFDAREDEKAKNDKTYKKQSFDSTSVKVDTKAYDDAMAYTTAKHVAQQGEAVKALTERYMSYEDKKRKLEEDYLNDIIILNGQYLETGDEMYKRSLDERYKAHVKAMNDLEKELGSGDYKLIFGDPDRMTASTIEKALDAARKKLAELDKEADPETFKALSDAIERLETARDNNPFQGWDTSVMGLIRKLYQIRNIRKDIAKYEKEGNAEAAEAAKGQLEKSKKDLNRALIGTGVAQFGDALSTAAATMKEVAKASGDIHLEQQAEALEKASGFVSSVASGAASGGWIGAIVGGATSLMNMFISSITESEAVAARAKKAYEDYLDELSHTARTIKDEDYESIFGVRALEKVRDALDLAKKSLEDYNSVLNDKVGSRWSYQDNPWIIPQGLGEQLVWEGRKQTARNAYKVPTLAERFPQLFNEDGTIKKNEAEAILKAYSEYAGEEWYEYLDDAYNALKDYEENLAVVDDYLVSLFSNVGSEIADAIMQGNDALEVLEDNAGRIFASIAKEMIMSVLMSGDFIEEYKKKLRDAMATEDAADDADVLNEIVDNLGASINDAKATWEKLKAIAEEKGIEMDLDGSDTQQNATSRGYQTLSEDTGNELVGRALAQYESNLRMEESMRATKMSVDIMAANQVQIRDIAAESRTLIADSYLELQQIRENTGAVIKPIKEMSAKMVEWDTYIKRL